MSGDGVAYKDIQVFVEQLGWVIFPTKRGEKTPYIKWAKYKDEKPSIDTIKRFFAGNVTGGAWLLTGISKMAVLDIDSEEAHDWWYKRLGPVMDRTPRVRTGKGWHYYFFVPDEFFGSPELKDRIHSSGSQPQDQWDFRGSGGVMVPPTYHVERQKHYVWDTADMRPSPADGPCYFASVEEIIAIFRSKEFQKVARVSASSEGFVLDEAIARFVKLGEGEGRNDAFKDIAMSAIRKLHGDLDYARTMLFQIYNALEDKTDFTWEGDCEKAIMSAFNVFNSSQITTPTNSRPAVQQTGLTGITASTPATGFMVPNVSNNILVEVPVKSGTAWGLEVFTNFNLVAKGVLVDGPKRTYLLDIHLDSGEIHEGASLPMDTLSSTAEFNKFLLNYEAYVYSLKAKRGNYSDAARFALYLKAQNPPMYTSTQYLGVQIGTDGSEFITHEGLITKDGLSPHRDIKPSPNLISNNYAPYKYKFDGTMRQALLTLAEVMTLHDVEATSIYASRFAALLHKGDLLDRGGLGFFPICGLEAPSGSGKTSGFFGFMNELSGCTAAAMVGTPAVIRNRMSAHRNVDVFIDDKNLPRAEASAVQEIFRNATQEGSIMKVDTRTNIEAIEQRIVGSALHAGEGLGIRSEKALLDRYLILNLTRPTGRLSLRRDKLNGEFQEQDVEAMRIKRIGKYSGWLVQRAMQVRLEPRELDKQLVKLGGAQTQRQGSKMRSLRYGARVLMEMLSPLRTEEGWCEEVLNFGGDRVLDGFVARVDEWCAEVDGSYDPNANSLDEFLAGALSILHGETVPIPGEGNRPPTPMWLATDRLWGDQYVIHFRFDYLIDWYKYRHAFDKDSRLRTPTALRQQLMQSYANHFKDSGSTRFHRPKGYQGPTAVVRWIVLSPEATDRLFILANLAPPERNLL